MPVIRISDALFKEVQKFAEPLVDDFETAMWKILQLTDRKQQSPEVLKVGHIKTTSRRVLSFEGTPQNHFRIPILESVQELGGDAPASEVCERVESNMKSVLKPADYQNLRDGTQRWFKSVNFQRLWLVSNGLLDSNAPRGTWRITERGKQWLKQQKTA
jgi:hypothetical protein